MYMYMCTLSNHKVHSSVHILCIYFLHTGVFCQTFFSAPTEKCPGDDVTFTCVVVDTSGFGTTTWNVTTPAGESSTCEVRHNLQRTATCGPNGEFSSSNPERNGVNYTSTLSVSISGSADFNGTTVDCLNQTFSEVGSEDICIVGESSPCCASSVIMQVIAFTEFCHHFTQETLVVAC